MERSDLAFARTEGDIPWQGKELGVAGETHILKTLTVTAKEYRKVIRRKQGVFDKMREAIWWFGNDSDTSEAGTPFSMIMTVLVIIQAKQVNAIGLVQRKVSTAKS